MSDAWFQLFVVGGLLLLLWRDYRLLKTSPPLERLWRKCRMAATLLSGLLLIANVGLFLSGGVVNSFAWPVLILCALLAIGVSSMAISGAKAAARHLSSHR